MNVTNSPIDRGVPPTPTEDGQTPLPNVPEKPEDVPERNSGTPIAHFEEMSDEELEELFDMFSYGLPLYGILQTGDETPLYPFIFGSAGILALLLALRKKKRRL